MIHHRRTAKVPLFGEARTYSTLQKRAPLALLPVGILVGSPLLPSSSNLSLSHDKQADLEVELELPELQKAELVHHEWKLDNVQIACDGIDASVPVSIRPFGLLVLASHYPEEHTAVFFRVFKTSADYAVLM